MMKKEAELHQTHPSYKRTQVFFYKKGEFASIFHHPTHLRV
jgi:hypothetical protein